MRGSLRAEELLGENWDRGAGGGSTLPPDRDECLLALAGFEKAVLDACSAEDGEWPEQVAAGIYAGVDFVIANPVVAHTMTFDGAVEADSVRHYERLIGRLAGFVQIKAPAGSRLAGSTDEVLVAGIVGLVGDHIRVGRVERLAELRSELVLLTLLPYLGLNEAQRWSRQVDQAHSVQA